MGCKSGAVNPYKLGGAMTGYVYDGEGTRVAKGIIKTMSCDPTISQLATSSDYILGPSGEQVTEMAVASGVISWKHSNIWSAAGLLGTYDSVGLHFYFDDPLGTRRAQTTYAGVNEQSCASLPFGNAESCFPTPTEHLFTGKERDTESNLDYFGARYYASNMGRWMSPDWSAKAEPVPYAKLDNPQSLNLYAYLNNNPLRAADLDGHDDYDGKVHVTPNADGTKTATQGTQTTSTSQTKDANGNVTSTTTTTTKTMNTVQLDADGKVTSATASSTTTSQTVDSKGAMTGSTNQTSTSTLAENSSQVTSLQQAAQTWTQRTLAGDALNNIPGSGAVPFMSTITKLLNATGTTVSDLLKNDPGPGNAACSKGGVDCF